MKIQNENEIRSPEYPAGIELARELAKRSAEVKKDNSGMSPGIKTVVTLPVLDPNEILTIVINMWRIKGKMTDSLSKQPKEEIAKEDIKKVARYLESIYNAFTQLGIEIIDRTGEPFDYGLPEKVVATIPQEGISKERVLETLRPTVKWNNHIYPGEVEIATPITKKDKRKK
ncbi:MAG: hypothetical protein F2923_00335 [Actinobacteria bacterium]|uniref:Unannotated protein n=1 Tax=freshwater metagenome TaxID=449393 RepID=A0A6J7RYL1_9ZZZZ|nr:hypothetical protein [Actinomycetota bacterium]